MAAHGEDERVEGRSMVDEPRLARGDKITIDRDGIWRLDKDGIPQHGFHASMPSNRGPSAGPWGRLKPIEQDPLDSIGLPSKGDTRFVNKAQRQCPRRLTCHRLLDSKLQERYYTKIVERYLSFCSDAGDKDVLLARFASLNLSQSSGSLTIPSASLATSATITALPSKDLTDVLMALRKLREGLVASKRADDFAAQVYLFCARLAILARQPEAYHPALLHLLRFIHPRHPLTTLEAAEAASYLVLDAACRRGEVAEALLLKKRLGLRDARIDAVLRALVADNWVAFRRLLGCVDAHRRRLMEFAEPEMRVHALKCVARTYLSVELEFLERSTGKSFAELRNDHGVGWESDGRRVVVRKVKGKT